MVIIMKENATEENIKTVCEYVTKFNLSTHVVNGAERSIIGVIGNVEILEDKPISSMEGVYDVVRISSPYKLVSRSAKPDNTIVRVKNVDIGGNSVMMAGPCAVESYEQMLEAAKAVKKSGAKVLRGGEYKPRSSPYSFQGL